MHTATPSCTGLKLIPIAALSALAAFFIGAAIVVSAGPRAFPARYLFSTSTSADLRRTFVPLVAGVVLVENIAFVGLTSWFNVHDSVLVAFTLVVFILITVLIVSRVAGSMGRALEEAEDQLVRKNEDLGAANEELTAVEEELRQNIHELANAERTLRESEERFRTIAEVSPLHLSIARKSDGKILFTNPAYDKAFGYAPGELLGYKTPDLYYDPADREVILGIFREQGSVENQDHQGPTERRVIILDQRLAQEYFV